MTVAQYGDVMKVDFGTQVEGSILDCAWTVSFDPQFDPLLEAAREATNTGIRHAGIDVPLNEVREWSDTHARHVERVWLGYIILHVQDVVC